MKILLFIFIPICLFSQIIANHTAVDDFDIIPARWIDSVQTKLIWQYAHASHGSQILLGMTRLETSDPTYSIAYSSCVIPTESGAMRIFDGCKPLGVCDIMVTALEYWATIAGIDSTRSVLTANPTFTLASWMACYEFRAATLASGYVQSYLDSIAILESEYPDITFIYMTGHQQSYQEHWEAGGDTLYDRLGWQAHQNNDLIRQYCTDSSKALFDFGDIDCWHDGERDSSFYSPNWFYRENDEYNYSEAYHTCYENIDNKAKAIWWLLARLAGWDGEAEGGGSPPPKKTDVVEVK